MTRLSRLLIVAVAFIVLSAPSVDAAACECIPMSDQTAFERSTAVFWGEATSVKSADGRQVTTFTVKKWYKGGSESTVAVHTRLDLIGCGYEFIEGRSYLVFAHGSGELGTGMCSKTRGSATEPTQPFNSDRPKPDFDGF